MTQNHNLRLKGNTFLALLPTETVAQMHQVGSLMHYQDKQLIHSRGEIKPGLSIVLHGSVFAGVSDPSGKQLIAGMLGTGHCFGEFTLYANLPRTHDVSAIGNTEVLQLPEPVFSAHFANDSKVITALLGASLQRMHILLETLDAIRRLPLVSRTAKILLTYLYSSGLEHYIPCKQSEIANTLGVTRVSMGKALKTLQSLALIELGYGKIMFPDLKRFEAWVDKACAGTVM